MMEDKKNLYIILGCNGSGKTIYFNFFLKKRIKKNNYLNIETILCPSTKLLRIEEAIKKEESLVLESIFAGETICEMLSIIDKAKRNNFKINVFFVHTNNCDINITNVQKNFSIGLLDFIDVHTLKQKHIEISGNVKEYSSLFDSLVIIDNSEYEFVEVAKVIGNRKIEFDINYLIRNPQKLMNKKTFLKKYSLEDDDRRYIDYVELSYFNNN